MCWVCNPLCGGCRPPRKKAVFCPDCQTMNVFDIVIAEQPASNPCRQCGKELVDLVTPKVVLCIHAGQYCANPCGFRAKEPSGGVLVDCIHRTAPLVCVIP